MFTFLLSYYPMLKLKLFQKKFRYKNVIRLEKLSGMIIILGNNN